MNDHQLKDYESACSLIKKRIEGGGDIRSWTQYINGVWDLQRLLAGCFGNGAIRPGNLDGVVERNGKTLIIETKSLIANLPEAQARMFRAWRCIPDHRFRIMVVWGVPPYIEHVNLIGESKTCDIRINPCGAEKWRDLCTKWYAWADSRSSSAPPW